MEQMHKTLPTNEVIAGVIKALETVPRVVLPVRGTSMLPFIIGDVALQDERCSCQGRVCHQSQWKKSVPLFALEGQGQ